MGTNRLKLRFYIPFPSRFKKKRIADSERRMGPLGSTHPNYPKDSKDSRTRGDQRSRLMALPYDVFIHILDLLCLDSEQEIGRSVTNRLIRTLSCVSVQFRDAVLNTPSFWTKIDNNYLLRDGFEDRIARSKNEPLQLDLDLPKLTMSQEDEALSLLVRFKDRWEQMKIRCLDIEQVVMDRPRMRFPRVRRLDMVCDYHWWSDAFFGEWSFPELKTLRLANVASLPEPSVVSNLTSFSFMASHYLLFSFRRYSELLVHMPRLQTLELVVPDRFGTQPDVFPIVDDSELGDFPAADLRHLSELRITSNSIPIQTVGRLFMSMNIPNVRRFSLTLTLSTEEAEGEWVATLFPQAMSFPKVESLFFLTTRPIHAHAAICLFAAFPNVQEMVLLVPKFVPVVTALLPELKLGHLRSLIVNGQELDLKSFSDRAPVSLGYT